MRARFYWFCLCFLALVTSVEARSPFDGTQVDVERRVTDLHCIIAAVPKNESVTLELRHEAHIRKSVPRGSKLTVEKLRQSLEQPHTWPRNMRQFETAAWRIVDTTFGPDGVFGKQAQAACNIGCALYEASSIDMWTRVFVLAPASGAEVGTDFRLARVAEEYPDVPRAVITFAGFGDVDSFGFHYEEHRGSNVLRARAVCTYQP